MDSSDQSRLTQERTCATRIPGTICVNASFGGLVELKHMYTWQVRRLQISQATELLQFVDATPPVGFVQIVMIETSNPCLALVDDKK